MALRIDSSRILNSAGSDSFPAPGKTEMDFEQSLTQVQKVQQQELKEFLDPLERQGRKLSESFSMEDLGKFQDLVRSFLQSTFGQSRQLQDESYWDFRGQPKVLSRVIKIDHALEDLGKQVLSKQVSQLELLDKIDQIRGLIIDLLA